MPSYIQDIATSLPRHRYDGEAITRFLTESASDEEAARKVRIIARRSGILSRYSVLDDFNFPESRDLFNGHNPRVEERMRVYQREALPLALMALEGLKDLRPESITHVLTVSCTGLTAPGLELQIAHKLNLSQSCAKHAVNFIGCHGAFHALKMANQMVMANDEARVLVVSVELCSLHFQPSSTDDNILANSLFGDGAAACIISAEAPANKAIELELFTQRYFPEEDQLMAWNIHSDGFLLNLSSYVPAVVERGVPALFEDSDEEIKADLWAVHPGGKNILEAVEKSLSLPAEKLAASRKVLSEVGNLSSATILFVLNEIRASASGGETLHALGFGPGITIEQFRGKIQE